jgi:acyl-[acyl-carrier-protein] desaturase
MIERTEERDILKELEPVVETELNRHLAIAEEWHPHDFVPWGDGENYMYLGGQDWEPVQSKLGETARAAMHVNLLTEDNLPSYHREISSLFGRESGWGKWVGQWTAEEHKHGTAMYSYLMVTRGIDPVAYERARMQHMKLGYDSGDMSPLEGISYVRMQELATRISHRNTGTQSRMDGDVLAEKLLARIAKDENLHMIFYRNLGTAALEIAPNEMMQAITKKVIDFQMPGAASIPEFWEKAIVIAEAGIYDLDIHANKVIKPTLDQWNIWKREDLTGEGAAARDKLAKFISKLNAKVKEQSEKIEEKAGANEN